MAKFRTKQMIVEAFQFGYNDYSDLPAWAKKAIAQGKLAFFSSQGGMLRWGEIPMPDGIVRTEVIVRIDIGDWVIRESTGQYYSCTNEIFVATYEPI